MHGRKTNDVSKDKGEVVSSSGDDPLGGVDEQQETTRLAKTSVDNMICSIYFHRIGVAGK